MYTELLKLLTNEKNEEINNILNSLKGWSKAAKRIRFKEYGMQRYFERIAGVHENGGVQTALCWYCR